MPNLADFVLAIRSRMAIRTKGLRPGWRAQIRRATRGGGPREATAVAGTTRKRYPLHATTTILVDAGGAARIRHQSVEEITREPLLIWLAEQHAQEASRRSLPLSQHVCGSWQVFPSLFTAIDDGHGQGNHSPEQSASTASSAANWL